MTRGTNTGANLTRRRPTVSIENALKALPNDLCAKLGELSAAPVGVAELTIAVLPIGYRAALAVYGIIEPDDDGAPAEIVITRFGRKLIDACAEKYPPRNDIDVDRLVERGQAALEQAAAHANS